MHQITRRNRHLLKRFLAAALSAAAICTSLPFAPQTARAAAPYVSLRTRFKTLQTGQSSWMTLKNNTIGWKITRVATDDRTVAMVYGRKEDGFLIKGKSAGRTTVRARLKTASRKKYTTKLVKCRVSVIPSPEQGRTQAVVTTQEELQAALAENSIRTLAIRTPNAAKFTIPKGLYTNTELTVDAPLADVENHGLFQSVTIQSVKPDTWTEYAAGNTLRVLAQASRIIVEKGARLKSLQYAKADAKAKLEVNGAVEQVIVSEKTELQISGTPENVPEVSVEKSAADTVLVSQIPVHVTLDASAELKFLKGAEQSTVTIRSGFYKIVNETSASIKVTKPDGTAEVITSARVPVYQGDRYPSYTPSYTPSVTPPVTTGPSVIPTGPSVSGPGNGAGEEGTEEDEEPVFHFTREGMENFVRNTIKVESAYTVTKLPVKLQSDYTPVTASAILSFQLQEDPQALPEGVYAEWKCEGLSSNGSGDWERLEGSSTKFTLDEQTYVNRGSWPAYGENFIGPVVTLRFQSDTMEIQEPLMDVIVAGIDTELLFQMKRGDMFLRHWTYMKTSPMPLESCRVYTAGILPVEATKVFLTTLGISRDEYIIDFEEHDPL